MPDDPHAGSLSDGSTRTPVFDNFVASIIPDGEIRKKFLADLGARLFTGQSLTHGEPHPDTHA